MCPACRNSSLAPVTAAVTSTAGITATVESRLGRRKDRNQAERHGEAESGFSNEHFERETFTLGDFYAN